jgi:hypothetical protein
MSKPGGKKKRCTKAFVKKVALTTQVCFDEARSYVLDNADENMDSGNIDAADVRRLKSKIDDEYLENIKKLSSEDLEDILLVHDKKKIFRAPRTIETIISELARRDIMDDKSDSK